MLSAVGEDDRTPMPWRDAGRFDGYLHRTYRTFLGSRSDHYTLRRGWMPWLAADEHATAQLWETPRERVRVVAAVQRTGAAFLRCP